MTPLRNQMIRELELPRMALGTIRQFVSAIAQLAEHYRRSPDRSRSKRCVILSTI